jgi:multiple sugar transport system substrate-binding protein
MKKIIYCAVLAFVIASATIVAGISVYLIKNTSTALASQQQSNENVTLTVFFNLFNPPKGGKPLLDNALNKLRSNHPSLNINVRYIETDYNNTRNQMLKAITNGTSIDIVSVDQIWLGEFAQKGLLTDLTNYTEKWGRASEWYQSNFAGGVYKGKVYGIWYETDVRGIWYWKDLLNKAGVDPNSLQTWDGYIESAKKLDSVLRSKGTEGVYLSAVNHGAPDLWYPYLWMLGGHILKEKAGHPTKGTYWFPAYNDSEGVRAMSFIKAQIDAGIKPQNKWYAGKEFANRNVSVMIEGSWMPSNIQKQELGNIGFIPMFPVPDKNTKTSTLMGGWEFSIPRTSSHKDLSWELIEIMLEPSILSPWLAEQVYLPTQINLGEGPGPYTEQLRRSIPFYDQMVSMIPEGGSRPSIPEYPTIAENIRQALDEVDHGLKDPKQALQEAAAKSAKALGW